VLSSYHLAFVILEPRISCSRVSCNCISTLLFIYSPGWFPSIDFHCAWLWPFVQYGGPYCRSGCGVLQVNSGRLCPIPVLQAVLDVFRNWHCICDRSFVKGNVEDGVMNSPLSRGASRSPVCSLSPLWGCDWTPIGQCSCSLTEQTVHISQRQLYSKPPVCSTEEAKEIDLVHYDKEVWVQPTTKLLESLSHGSGRHQLPEEQGRLFWTQSLTRQPPLQLSTRDCVSSGRNACSFVVNPTMSRHCLRLFGNVDNGSVHLLKFLIWKPIRCGTRFWKGLRSWSPGRWAV
jgi:hypothetical protein